MAVTRDEILGTTGLGDVTSSMSGKLDLMKLGDATITRDGQFSVRAIILSDKIDSTQTKVFVVKGDEPVSDGGDIEHLPPIKVGTTLLTKDGRYIGNAIVISEEFDTVHRAEVYTIETDFGNHANLTDEEIRMDFYISRQTSLERWRTDKHDLAISNSGFDIDSLDAIEWKAIGAITPEDQATIYKLIKSTIARLSVSSDIVRAKLQTYFNTTGLKTVHVQSGQGRKNIQD